VGFALADALKTGTVFGAYTVRMLNLIYFSSGSGLGRLPENPRVGGSIPPLGTIFPSLSE
jgi:hypothetical protein